MRYWKIAAVLAIAALLTATALAARKTMSVQLRSTSLRAKPSPFGKVVGTLNYGDRVRVLKVKEPWTMVSLDDSEGWVSSTALTRKKVVLKAGKDDVTAAATSDEMVLAGKGFNQEVEKEYRNKNKKLDYTWIDKMEGFVVSSEQMTTFLKQGGLDHEGGAR